MFTPDLKLGGMKNPVAPDKREFVERLTYLRDKLVTAHHYQAAKHVNDAIAEMEKA